MACRRSVSPRAWGSIRKRFAATSASRRRPVCVARSARSARSSCATCCWRCILAAAQCRNLDLRGARVALQGFGRVGTVLAEMLAEAGVTLVALADYREAVANAAGIDAGAADPRDGSATAAIDWARARDFWAFQPVVKPAVPAGPEANPIDRFIRAKLTEKGLTPVGPADRRALIRRVTIDMTGLPPVN